MLQLNLEFYTRCMSEVRAEGETKVSETFGLISARWKQKRDRFLLKRSRNFILF